MKLEDDIKAAFGRHADDAAPNPWAWSHVQEGVQRAQKRRAVAMSALSVAIVATMGAAVARIASTGPEPGGFASSHVTTFRFVTTGDAQEEVLTLAGEVDLSGGLRAVEFTLAPKGTEGQPIDIVVDGDVVYMDRRGEWVPAKLDPFSAVFFGGSMLSPLSDPTGHLTRIRGFAKAETELGAGTVRGVDVTGYELTIDTERAMRRADALDRQILKDTAGITLRVWVDDDGIVRRQVMILRSPGSPAARFTTELFDFGTDVSIDVPRVDEEPTETFMEVLYPTYTGTSTCTMTTDGAQECTSTTGSSGSSSVTFECTGATIGEDGGSSEATC